MYSAHSARFAARETGTNNGDLAATCRGVRGKLSAGGFKWKFRDDVNVNEIEVIEEEILTI